MSAGYKSLTEREKQTLRLVVQGYDAKSMARQLDLSVHTVNERLRCARRKMAVSSSREAARLLRDVERSDPDFLADKSLGEASGQSFTEDGSSNDRTAGRRLAWSIPGVTIMTVFLAIAGLATLAPSAQLAVGPDSAPPAATESTVVQSARQWLALVDQGNWRESWAATGQAFRKLNTAERWADVSVSVRTPLGAVLSRTAASQERVPAPPHGYEIVKFRTSFANKPDAVETLSLVREGNRWKVVGYVIG